MKNKIKLLGTIALTAVIGFALITCEEPITSSQPALKGTVTIDGTAEVGQTLTVNTTSLGGSGLITFQWMRGGAIVIGSSATYTLQTADTGSTITVTVTRSDNSGSVTSPPTATITVPSNPVTSDFIIDNLFQTEGKVSAVAITPRDGKSTGKITIYYDGLTTLPLIAGTYTVTFDVAAIVGWNAAVGLDGGVLTISNKINAQIPNIITQPISATVTFNLAHSLSVEANSPDDGILTYQWYSNTFLSNNGGSVISGATSAVYNPPTTTEGTYNYFVEVTNTISDNGDGGNKTATVKSNVITLTVNSKVNAQTPNITSHPNGGTVLFGGTHNLSVTANVTDGGTLSYRWYSNTSQSNSSGSVISGATSATYNPPTSIAGTYYYFLEIINTIPNNGDGGSKTASIKSNAITLTVNDKVNAQLPNITTQPLGATVIFNGSHSLSVAASVTDGGTLAYQWYSNNSASNTGGSQISGATSSTYSPPTSTAGTYYYFVEIINTITNNGDGGNKTASVRSYAVTLTVNARVNAQTPNISNQPTGGTIKFGEVYDDLSVLAYVTDGGTLSYRWYSNTNQSNSGGTAITGATSATYIPPTNLEGTYYYFVEVTNTIFNNGDGGTKIASIRSNAVTLTVNAQVNAHNPHITTQPVGASVIFGGVHNLSVVASVTDGGALSYQWYRNTNQSNSGGTVISGATSASYNPLTNTAGAFYYFVEITNTISNNGDGGNKTAVIRSNAVEISIISPSEIVINLAELNDWELTEQNVNTAANVNTIFTVNGTYESYQWYLDGVLVGSSSSYTFNEPADVYQLVVVVTNAEGESRSGRCWVTVELTSMYSSNYNINGGTGISPPAQTVYAGTGENVAIGYIITAIFN